MCCGCKVANIFPYTIEGIKNLVKERKKVCSKLNLLPLYKWEKDVALKKVVYKSALSSPIQMGIAFASPEINERKMSYERINREKL